MSWRCTTSSWGTIPILVRSDAYSVWMLWPSKVTEPEDGVAYPAISRDSVVLPAPDPPISAVSVPGRATSEIRSSRFFPSMPKLTSRTSRPPARVAAS